MSALDQQLSVQSYDDPSDSISSSVNVDKVVQSVTNATKRLSQISTNTNNSAKKRKTQNKIGPWKLGRTLGRGSTGRVRLAKNIVTSKLAAVKIVPKSNFKLLENPKYKHPPTSNNKDRLPYGIEREIIIMKLISHPNIMGLYDVWENKNDLYLILEYIEGGELFDYLIKRGRLQEFEAVNYFKQIISGISYLHQFNICHRDLKPENLLLDHNKNIKIADFGMAALEVREKLLETSCGSPHYASPEIVAGKNYHGAPSDIWSCGIILFALLTGHLPFDDENIRKLLLKVQSGKFIMPPELSWEAKDLISKMLKVDPTDRISIEHILTHPLYTKYPEPAISSSSSALNFQNFNVKPIESVDKIDKEILKNLSVLFHNCEEKHIIAKLLSPAKCSEKMFYYLLMKYRNEHIACNSFEDEKNQYNEEVDDPKPTIPRSTSIVKTTIYDQTTGEKHTTIKKVPKSPSTYSNKSLKRVQQASKLGSNSNFKVLSNITNTVSPNSSVRNFKASTSFNRKKTLLNTQSMSRNNSATNSLKSRHKDGSKTNTQRIKSTSERTKASSNDTSMSSDNPRYQKSKPPQLKPPTMARNSTGLLGLEALEQITDKSSSRATSDNLQSTNDTPGPRNPARTSISSSAALARERNMTGTFGNKSLLNFKMICEEMFNEEEGPQRKQPSSRSTSANHSQDRKHTLANKERELAAKVHALNDVRERKYREEELRKQLEKKQMEKKRLEEEKKQREIQRNMEEERKRQSLILQEKQRQALERLSKHQSTNDFADQFVSPKSQRYVTEPPRPLSLDPKHTRNVNSLLRAKSLAAPSPFASSRNDNTSKVLHKLGIDVIPQSPRKLDSSLKTSSSKNLSGYLKGSSYTIQQSIQEYEEEDIEISEVLDEDYDETNKENDMTLESYNQKEEKLRTSALRTSSVHSKSSNRNSQKTNASGSPTIPYRSLLRDINETSRINDLNKSTVADETFMTTDTIHRSELIPNPRFSRFSFGGILSKETNEIGDITILNNTLNYSNTVVRKPKNKDVLAEKNAEFDSKYCKTSRSGSMLKKSSTTNLLGLGIKLQNRQSSTSSQYVVEELGNSADEFNATLPSAAISIRESDIDEDDEEEEEYVDNEFDDFGENDSEETMLDETEIRDEKSIHGNATTIMDEDYSNLDIISTRTADVGKFNTMRPSIVESKETLILPPSPVEEEGPETSNRNSSNNNESIKSLYKDYEKLHGDRHTSSNLIEMNKPDLKPDQHAYYRLSTRSNIRSLQDKGNDGEQRNGLQRESLKIQRQKTREDYNMSKNFEILDTSSIVEEAAAEEKSRSSQIFSSRTLSKVQQSEPANEPVEEPVEEEFKGRQSSIRRRMSLKPKREAPKVPGDNAPSNGHRFSHFSMNEPGAPKKNNWFKKIINAITSSPATKSKSKFDSEEVAASTLNVKSFNIIDSSLTSVELTRVIKTHLELKLIEGSISHVDIDEEFGLITGVIPAKYSHGRKLKFKIEIIDLINSSSLHLIKVKGNEKGFKNLANIVTFVIRQEELATGRRPSGFTYSGQKTKA